MSLIPNIENVIKKLIIPNYSKIINFEVKDLFENEGIDSWLGNKYIVDFTTSECLSPKEQMEIDTDVKTLFKMLSPNKKMNREPEISSFFDCGDGEGFTFESEYGYHH